MTKTTDAAKVKEDMHALKTSFGGQVDSTRPSNGGFSFGADVVKEYPRAGVVKYRSPGPATYNAPSSMSKQGDSQKTSFASYGFSAASRFATECEDTTWTGPRDRPDIKAFGKQSLSTKKSCTGFGFSKSSRFGQ